MTDNTYKAGKNLKSLRRFYNIKQKDLAKMFNLSQSQFSMLENGTRFISVDMAKQFAKYFRVTLEQFLNDDLEHLESTNIVFNIADSNLSLYDIYPIFLLPDDIHNDYFELAIDKWNKAISSENLDTLYMNLSLCIEKFRSSLKQVDMIETRANIATTVLLAARQFHLDTRTFAESFQKNPVITNKEFASTYAGNGSYKEDFRNNFLEKYSEDFFACLKELKSSPDFYELGDYYLALSFINGIVNNNLDKERNEMIGDALMCTLYELDNEYAISWLNYCLSNINDD